jgi:hypothetical protein
VVWREACKADFLLTRGYDALSTNDHPDRSVKKTRVAAKKKASQVDETDPFNSVT